MYGRYTLLRIVLTRVEYKAFQIPKFEEASELRPRFNVAPGQDAPIIHLGDDGKRAFGLARWRLIPSWTKGKPKVQPSNARDDKVCWSARCTPLQ